MRANLWLYGGLAAVVVGLATLAWTWGRVAGLTTVPEQIPYVLSGGGVAIVAVLIGVRLLELHGRVQDAARRMAQLDELVAGLEELRGHLDDAPVPQEVG